MKFKHYRETMEIIKKAEYKGMIMKHLGESFIENNDMIYDYRTNGLLGGFELNTDLETMDKIKKNLYEEGIFCYSRGKFIFTAPPLTIDQDLLFNTMHKINTVIYNNSNKN